MAAKIALIFILSFVIFGAEVKGSIPNFGVKFYLRSTLDNGYLKPWGNGELCKQLSALTTIPTKDYSEASKWRFQGGQDMFWVDQDSSLDRGYSLNPFSLYSPPPSCYQVFNELILLSNNDQYIFKSKREPYEPCLYNKGFGQGVYWAPCNYTTNFIWKFELA